MENRARVHARRAEWDILTLVGISLAASVLKGTTPKEKTSPFSAFLALRDSMARSPLRLTWPTAARHATLAALVWAREGTARRRGASSVLLDGGAILQATGTLRSATLACPESTQRRSAAQATARFAGAASIWIELDPLSRAKFANPESSRAAETTMTKETKEMGRAAAGSAFQEGFPHFLEPRTSC